MAEDKENEGAGLILFANDTQEFVVGKRSDEVSQSHTLSIPSGHLEQGEDPKKAALREFREETGFDDLPIINVMKVHTRSDEGFTFHTYVGYTPEKRKNFDPHPKHAHEHDMLGWVTPEWVMNADEKLHPDFAETLKSIDLGRYAKEAKDRAKLDEQVQKKLMEFRVSGMKHVRKEKQSDAVFYYFTDQQFQKFAKFLSQAPYNEKNLEDSIFIQRLGEDEEITEDDEDLADKFADIDKRKRSGDIDEPLYKLAQNPENFEGKGWVVKVPDEVLEEIDDLVTKFKQNKPEKFEEAKNWYYNLNDIAEEVSNNEAEKSLFCVLLAIGSINTPFLTNFFEASVMFAAVQRDLQEGHGDKLVQYLNEPFDKKYALKQYKDAVKEFRKLKEDIEGEVEGYADKAEKDTKVEKLNELREQIAEIRDYINRNQEEGYTDLATFYSLNHKILSPLRSKTSGKLYNIVELIVSHGPDMEERDAVDALTEVLDYSTKRIYDIKPKRQDFMRGMKVANFALNILQPDLAEDRMYELNTTIDTWMVKALWPGINYGRVSDDPFAYNYLASQTAKMAREYDLLTQEMQAIIWVAMIDEDDPDMKVTASAIAETVEDIMEYLGLIEETGERAEELSEQVKTIINQFNDLEDFKSLKAQDMKSVFHGAAVSGKSPKERELSESNDSNKKR